ncbi:hypothetical protein P9112_006067 [Eukaryota sp. TZLM1-RC]
MFSHQNLDTELHQRFVPSNQLSIKKEPFAEGGNYTIHRCVYDGKPAVVKLFSSLNMRSSTLLEQEIVRSFALNSHHIKRSLCTTKYNERIGLVMESASSVDLSQRVDKLDVTVRLENQQDYRRVEEVAREAFWNLYFPGANEHCIVHKMRNHPDFIKELAFVVEVEGKVEGAIFYTQSKIVSKDNTFHETISFGPVFISPALHRKGLGRKLITHSIKVARDMGHRAITTLGYPYHYEPYGFLGGKRYNISLEDGKFYKGLLVLPLYEEALSDISGYVTFSEALDVTEEEVHEFDQSFPFKEKKYQESQEEFSIACSMLDE